LQDDEPESKIEMEEDSVDIEAQILRSDAVRQQLRLAIARADSVIASSLSTQNRVIESTSPRGLGQLSPGNEFGTSPRTNIALESAFRNELEESHRLDDLLYDRKIAPASGPPGALERLSKIYQEDRDRYVTMRTGCILISFEEP